jgi:phytanoyl-CoA hydroxylase
MIAKKDLLFFNENGYLIKRKLFSLQQCGQLRNKSKDILDKRIIPYELETELNYPDGPIDKGNNTIRRIKQIYARDKLFSDVATNQNVINIIKKILNTKSLIMSQNHHNCIMTKQPKFSSRTDWHQDIRYWSFIDNNLVSFWLALTIENKTNGSLNIIPGSHLLDINKNKFDSLLFFKKKDCQNKKILKKSISVELEIGDAIFFHCNLLHSALSNRTEETKYSIVFTYYSNLNQPRKNTRSALLEDIEL